MDRTEEKCLARFNLELNSLLDGQSKIVSKEFSAKIKLESENKFIFILSSTKRNNKVTWFSFFFIDKLREDKIYPHLLAYWVQICTQNSIQVSSTILFHVHIFALFA